MTVSKAGRSNLPRLPLSLSLNQIGPTSRLVSVVIKNFLVQISLKKSKNKRLQRPGIEPGPPAWQASILPLNQRCCVKQGARCIGTREIHISMLKKVKNFYTQSVGFEPTLPEGI